MKILVLTEHDDCCGPMAAAFLRDYSQNLEVVSAGISPSENIQALAVAAMKECLIDLSAAKPKVFDKNALNSFDFLIIIGDADEGFQINAARMAYLNPEITCQDMDSMRQLRDWIKNEVFIVYKNRLH